MLQFCGFLFIMKIIMICISIPFAYSGYHSLITTYTGIRGVTEIPEFIAVTTLDGQQIDYYDSITNELIPKQDWMKEYTSGEMWKEDTKIRQEVHQIYRKNIHDLMQRFNQTKGVHVYQRMYGCYLNKETGESHVLDQYGYDGENYVSLDMYVGRYITPVPEGMITVQKWNNDIEQLDFLRQFYSHECVYWLKQFLKSRNPEIETRAPEVFLLQKSSSSPVECFASGFYPLGVSITWFKNGEAHDKDVDLGETLPNEDGTFQKSSRLNIFQFEREKGHLEDQYTCVVEHQGIIIQKTEDEIKRNKPTNSFLIIVCVMVILSLVIGLSTWLLVLQKKPKAS